MDFSELAAVFHAPVVTVPACGGAFCAMLVRVLLALVRTLLADIGTQAHIMVGIGGIPGKNGSGLLANVSAFAVQLNTAGELKYVLLAKTGPEACIAGHCTCG